MNVVRAGTSVRTLVIGGAADALRSSTPEGESMLAASRRSLYSRSSRSGRRASARLGRAAVEALELRTMLAGDVFVTVLHDLNGNGSKDPEEPPLEGWTVFVDLDSSGTLDPDEPW